MIGGDRRELIFSWFVVAREANRTLPPRFLPLVLERVPPTMRAGASTVLGVTAAWLGQLNSSWTVTLIVAEPSEQRWQEGTLEERRAELAASRHAIRNKDDAGSRRLGTAIHPRHAKHLSKLCKLACLTRMKCS